MAEEAEPKYSIAVFPFLKTESPVRLGDLEFRSTIDVDGLPQGQASSVVEVSRMLFLRDNLRIRSASYAIVPLIDLTYSVPDVPHLSSVQAVVAYLYAAPTDVYGRSFLTSEHATMVVLTPDRISPLLVRSDVNVEPIGDLPAHVEDGLQSVPGYAGLYNFRHHFWVVAGSRIYGPMPHLTLNLQQDLSMDIRMAVERRSGLGALLRLLNGPVTENSARALTAIRWFNEANREARDDDDALVSLAIAFESLLALPQSEKTDRLVDAIALLLGRVPRLDTWARQFYAARSSVAHEGHARTSYFIARDARKGLDDGIYQPLLSYGMRIFRLCLLTLLAGADLAEEAGLEEKFVTNQERFEKVCEILKDLTMPARERLTRIKEMVSAIDRYSYLSEKGLQLETMIAATRRAIECLIECDKAFLKDNKMTLVELVADMKSREKFEQLEAVKRLETYMSASVSPVADSTATIVVDLVKVVWRYVFMHYFWLERQRSAKGTQG